ncbi:putative epidermal cell surface receptor isoform X2 [Planococcus citri]|uniref:putative epidermal cell surface receptor isoform X2 n=1 Tax=Planococcus citri TaxID=170843 RepID=UPI0031F96433
MGKFFHLCVIVCLCLTRRFVHAEETGATSKCQLNANGVVGPDCNLNATTTTTTSSASPLPKSASGNGTENGRARAMNYTLSFQDAMRSNGLKVPGMDFKEHSIDDVSMDEMNDDSNLNYTSLMSNFHNMMNVLPMVKNTTASTCTDNNKTYKIGEKFNKGCNETCQCVKPNEIMCGTICKPPYQVKGRNKDPSCIEVPVDGNSCCVLLNCPAIQDLEAEPIESCYHKNETYKRGSTFNDTCDVCICEAGGRVNCKSRCPRLQNATGNCLAVQDPEDPCCKRILCDVEEHDVNKVGITASDETGISSSTTDNQIISAKALNGTSVSLTFAEKSKDCNVEVSENGVDWNNMECVENTIGGLEPGKKYQFRLKNTASNKVEVTLPRSPSLTNSSLTCSFKGKTYNIGEEFHDGCDAYCICETTGVDCARIECPTDFGLDVLDPQCVSWEMHPPDFTPTPPYCCPDKIRCKDNGSCMYNGENYPNWSELPVKATGCENRCYCEMGKVSCSPMCAKISDTPPKDLLCPPEQAVLQKPPDDECCLHWTCPHVGRPGNETIKSEKKEHATNTLDNTEFTQNENNFTSTIYSTDETTKPNSIDRLTTVTYNTKKPLTNSKNTTDKKEFYPGPFSPQYFAKNENSSMEKSTKKPNHGMLADLLSPFHLEKFASEIEKNIHSNDTSSMNKKPGKKPTGTKGYAHNEEEEEEEDEEDHYDEKNQYEDLFTDLFDPKNKNKNSSKHSIWNIKPPEIPPFVKNPNLPENEYAKEKSTTESIKHSETPGEFPKKHIPSGSKDSNKKQKPQFDQDKPYDVKISEQNPNNFLPYPNIPYTIPDNVYPNVNPHLKYPPSEILIHQAPQNPNLGYNNNKYKPTPINDPNQSEEFYHLIDNDAYNDEQIRQNLHYGQHEIHPQFGHVVKLTKDGVRLQNPNEPNTPLNVEEVLTHLHHETNNNNVHLPNILPGGPPRHQVPIHNFGYQNYHETLNADQTSHPLLLQPELLNQHNNTNRDEVKIHVLEAVDESTVKLVFSVPQVLVGLHGRVELRYTSDQQNNEPSTWEHQILAPPDDLIATAELEFELTGLQPNTTYKIKISVVMSDVGNAPTSNILSIRTPASAPLATTLPPIIPVEPELRAIEVNATYVKVGWRMFSDTELQFIDGVQLRYKELDDKVYAATPLIHRAVTTYTIEQLKPNSIYEIGIFFIPFPGQTTELQAQKTIQIRTGLEFDPYKFDIMVEVHHIKASSIEITWSGVPYPEDKYVNIFRAIYQSDGSREDFSTFKVAKRDSSQNILIQDLKPGTRYRLWLEAYLTNGRTKKSNVKDFITKIGPALPPSTSQGKLEGTPLVEANTYYGPLVAVSILATIAITSTIILILILAKKHGTIKAPITTPINRKNNTSAAYDNQAYKVDIQHETMDL